MEAVDVLGRVDGVDDQLRVEAVRQRQLDEDAVDGVILVEARDLGEQGLAGRRLGHLDEAAVDRRLAGHPRLGADIRAARRVIAEDDDVEARAPAAAGLERLGAGAGPGAERRRMDIAVDQGGHGRLARGVGVRRDSLRPSANKGWPVAPRARLRPVLARLTHRAWCRAPMREMRGVGVPLLVLELEVGRRERRAEGRLEALVAVEGAQRVEQVERQLRRALHGVALGTC